MLRRLCLVCLTDLAHCFSQPTSAASPDSGEGLRIILNGWTVDLWRTFLVSLKEGECWRTRIGFTWGLKRSHQCLPPPSQQPQKNILVPPVAVWTIPSVPSSISAHNSIAFLLSASLVWDTCYFVLCGKIAGCASSLQLCSRKLASKRTEASGVQPKRGVGRAQSRSFSACQNNACLNDVCLLHECPGSNCWNSVPFLPISYAHITQFGFV